MTAPLQPLLLNAESVGELIGVSRSYVYQLQNAGQMPTPIKLGTRTLWRFDEIKEWTRAGCPARDAWEQLTKEK